MGENRAIGTTGQRKRIAGTLPRKLNAGNRRARCEYCCGWVSDGEDRQILIGDETKYVHARHPRRDGERYPEERYRTGDKNVPST